MTHFLTVFWGGQCVVTIMLDIDHDARGYTITRRFSERDAYESRNKKQLVIELNVYNNSLFYVSQ